MILTARRVAGSGLYGVSAVTCLVYYSWGFARAVFPTAANELSVAKVEGYVTYPTAVLPVGSRYMKSTILVVRNSAQIDQLFESFPQNSFSPVRRD